MPGDVCEDDHANLPGPDHRNSPGERQVDRGECSRSRRGSLLLRRASETRRRGPGRARALRFDVETGRVIGRGERSQGRRSALSASLSALGGRKRPARAVRAGWRRRRRRSHGRERVPEGRSSPRGRPQRLASGAVGAHAVALAVDLEDDRAVQEPVEHGGGDHRVVEDLAPARDAAVGGEDDRALQVAALDDLEEGGRPFRLQRQVAQLVDLCRPRHRSTYADHATMPTRGRPSSRIACSGQPS